MLVSRTNVSIVTMKPFGRKILNFLRLSLTRFLRTPHEKIVASLNTNIEKASGELTSLEAKQKHLDSTVSTLQQDLEETMKAQRALQTQKAKRR